MIIARVRRTIEERGLVPRGARVLAACSGGPDSAAMLVALSRLQAELGFELSAVSVDHGLRASSGQDVEVARAQAERLGVSFRALRVRVRGEGSLQKAARDARYAALLELARSLGAIRVAVGHTRDDQAETVLLRLLRGAGVAGLAGIEPLREDGVVRPLIDCTRTDVLAFATQHCPELAHDPSNEDPRFSRVRIRQEILPVLLREDASAISHLSELADDARDHGAAIARGAAELLAATPQADETLDVSAWGEAPAAVVRGALRAWLEPRVGPLSRAHLQQLERALGTPGEIWLPGGFSVCSLGEAKLRLSRSTQGKSHGP